MSEEDIMKALKRGDLRSAGKMLEKMEDELPRPRLLYLEGLLLERRGDHQGALKKYDMGLVMHLSNRSLWFAKARVLSHMGRMDLARRAVERGMRLSQNEPWAHVFYGDILLKLREYDAAMSEANKALSLDPDDPGAMILAGLVLSIRDQDFKSALGYFERAIEVDGKIPDAWSNRGMVLKNMGDLEGARISFRKALSLNPGDDMAKTALSNLEKDDVPPKDGRLPAAGNVPGGGDFTASLKETEGLDHSHMKAVPLPDPEEDEELLEWGDDEGPLYLLCPRCGEEFRIELSGNTKFRCPGCGLQGEVD